MLCLPYLVFIRITLFDKIESGLLAFSMACARASHWVSFFRFGFNHSVMDDGHISISQAAGGITWDSTGVEFPWTIRTVLGPTWLSTDKNKLKSKDVGVESAERWSCFCIELIFSTFPQKAQGFFYLGVNRSRSMTWKIEGDATSAWHGL